jgi:hypothetical protein
MAFTGMNLARSQRAGLINTCEWMRARHLDEIALSLTPTLTSTQYTQLLQYIQALRACINSTITNPAAIVWPAAPTFVAAAISKN